MILRETRPLMVFHAPYPLMNRPAASRLRPLNMRRAFVEAGYDVVEVTGYAASRRRAMARAERRLDDYDKRRQADPSLPPAFVYSENATIPNALTEPRHIPVHPLMDVSFFRQMCDRGVRVGVFYRDLYWRFPYFRKGINPVVDRMLRLAYFAELHHWKRLGLRVYLPSRAMVKHMPVIDPIDIRELPPGADTGSVLTPSRVYLSDTKQRSIELLFIGVVGENYRLDAVCEAVEKVECSSFTLCTRREEWVQAKDYYQPLLVPGRHCVVHASGAELEPLYARSDLGVLFVQPNEYWDFAVPYKLYEYLAHQLPIIATEGTEAGRIVSRLGIGWTLPYDSEALAQLLNRLVANPSYLTRVQQRMREILPAQTWRARALLVASDLSGWTPKETGQLSFHLPYE